jgi:hypothetical protein
MIINYRDKYKDFKLFFLKKMLKIMHIFQQKINSEKSGMTVCSQPQDFCTQPLKREQG